MPFKFSLVSDVRDFLRGTSNVEDALEDVTDAMRDVGDDARDAAREAGRALEDIGDDAKDAGRDVEKGLSKGLEETEDAARKTGRQFRDELADVSRAAKTTGDDVGDSLGDGAREASESLGEMGDEAKSIATETASSFDGSADSMKDAMQDAAANMLQGFGPIGTGIGLALAAGFGVFRAEAEKAEEKAQETAEAVAEITGELIEMDGAVNQRGPDKVRERLEEMATTAKDGKTDLEKLKEAAEELGVEWKDYVAGVAGDSDAATRSIAEITAKIKELEEAKTEAANEPVTGEIGVASRQATINGINDEIGSYKDLQKELAATAGMIDDGSQNYADYTAVVEASAAASADEADALEARNEAAEKAIDLNEAVLTGEIGWRAAIDETTTALAGAAGGLDLTTEAGRTNAESLIGLIEATTGYADAVREQGGSQEAVNGVLQEGYDRLMTAADGAGIARDQVAAYAEQLGLVPPSVTTTVTAEGAEDAAAALDGAAEDRTAGIDAETSGAGDASAELDGVAAPRDAPITADAQGVAGAQAELDALAAERDVDIRAKLVGKVNFGNAINELIVEREVPVRLSFNRAQAQMDLTNLIYSLRPPTVTIPTRYGEPM